jgi:hypothetical protein
MAGPFDYVKSINAGEKIPLGTDYNQHVINYVLSMYPDCIMPVAKANVAELSDEMHYSFLMASIKPRKRFRKFPKKPNAFEDVVLIAQYYKYNMKRAKEVLSVLTEDQIAVIKNYLKFEA